MEYKDVLLIISLVGIGAIIAVFFSTDKPTAALTAFSLFLAALSAIISVKNSEETGKQIERALDLTEKAAQKKEQYYPYAKATPKNDQWVESINIGFGNDYHKKFDIIVVLADKSAQDIFKDYVNTVNQKEENPYSQGLYLLPESAKEYDRIYLTEWAHFMMIQFKFRA